MQVRTVVALLVLAAGAVLAIVSYFFLAAPLGRPIDSSFSNPRVPFAAALLVLGVIAMFGSAIVYELFPGRREDEA